MRKIIHTPSFPALRSIAVAMSCFPIDLFTYVDLNEAKLEAWAKKFFVHHTWKKPLLFGEVSETDYKVKQPNLWLHTTSRTGKLAP